MRSLRGGAAGAIAAFGLLSAACSSSGPPPAPPAQAPPPSGPCTTAAGTYLETLTAISGNCGASDTFVVVFMPGPEIPTTCTGTKAVSANNCTVTLSDLKCSTNTPGEDFVQTGEITWSENGLTGSGVMQLTFVNASGDICSGAYNITYQQQ